MLHETSTMVAIQAERMVMKGSSRCSIVITNGDESIMLVVMISISKQA
jgi:hypothetical protein